jgi:hypothetical protein
LGSDDKFLRGRPTFRFSGAASSLLKLDSTLVKSKNSPSLLLVLLLTEALLARLPFFFRLSTESIFDDDASIILVDDIIGEVSGDAKATILWGLPGDLFTGATESLSELDAILPTLTNLASLLGVNRFETFAFPFRFVAVEVVGDTSEEVSGDAKATILRGLPGDLFTDATDSLSELDAILPTLTNLAVLLGVDRFETFAFPFRFVAVEIVGDTSGEVSGDAKATILRGRAGDLFTGVVGPLFELDAILLTSTSSPSLLGVNGFEIVVFPFRFVVVEVDGDLLGEVSGDAKAIILRGLGDLFTGVAGLLSELDAILLALDNMLGVNRFEIVVLSFRFAVVELEAFEEGVRRGRSGLLFIGVTLSLSELEAILSKSNDSPSLLSVTVALPFCFLDLRRLVDDRLRLVGDLLRLLGVASESESSSVTNISSLAMSGCWGPLRSAGGRRR